MSTQAEQILAFLKKGESLTPLDALQLFACFRLGARVWELKRAGHAIHSAMVDIGNGKHVAKYWMDH